MFKKIWKKLVHFVHSFYQGNLFPITGPYLHRIVGLIFLGIMSRLLPHPPNCTAINAIALFSICSLGNLSSSLFTLFTTMFLSDLLFGFHSSMGFVYLSTGLILFLGYGLRSKRSAMRTIFLLPLSSVLFFIVTNFGVWLTGSIYPKTLTGLELSYLAGIPFLANHLIGTLLYGGMLYWWLEFCECDTSAFASKNRHFFKLG